MKNWILNTFFKKEMDSMFEKAKFEGSKDAFKKAREDLEETNVYDTDEKAKVLAKKMLNDLLSVVDESQIMTKANTGIVFIGGAKVDDVTLSNLKAEAEFLTNSQIWKLMNETPKELAQRSMFVNGESLADLQKGKSMLYTLSTQNNILELCMKYGK